VFLGAFIRYSSNCRVNIIRNFRCRARRRVTSSRASLPAQPCGSDPTSGAFMREPRARDETMQRQMFSRTRIRCATTVSNIACLGSRILRLPRAVNQLSRARVCNLSPISRFRSRKGPELRSIRTLKSLLACTERMLSNFSQTRCALCINYDRPTNNTRAQLFGSNIASRYCFQVVHVYRRLSNACLSEEKVRKFASILNIRVF